MKYMHVCFRAINLLNVLSNWFMVNSDLAAVMSLLKQIKYWHGGFHIFKIYHCSDGLRVSSDCASSSSFLEPMKYAHCGFHSFNVAEFPPGFRSTSSITSLIAATKTNEIYALLLSYFQRRVFSNWFRASSDLASSWSLLKQKNCWRCYVHLLNFQ